MRATLRATRDRYGLCYGLGLVVDEGPPHRTLSWSSVQRKRGSLRGMVVGIV